ISPQLVGTVLMAGLVLISVVMVYAFYPSTAECKAEIRLIRAEAVSAARSGDLKHANYFLPLWEEWSRRIEVGTTIRRGGITPYQSMQGYLLRKKIERLKHELEHLEGESDGHANDHDLGPLIDDLLSTDTRWKSAYRTQ
ncbi:MAG: permease, partial [Planctomycetota bacterium]